MSAMKTQKAAEDSQNKENRNDSREFMVLQTQLAFFPGSRSRQVILNKLSEIFWQYNKSFINQACSVEMAGISLVLFSHFYGSRLSLVHKNSKKETWPISRYLDLTLG